MSMAPRSLECEDGDSNISRKILIPDTKGDGFSFRKFWAFTGPGFLLCIAYMDPGNIEADIQSGVSAKYKILWVLLGSTVLALLMQRLSLRLGVVTGHHLAEMCYLQYPRVPRTFLWLMTEVAIIGSDMQEVIGTAIALYLLSNRLIPLWFGVVITIVDTFMFLLLDNYGLRKLEIFFSILVAVMVFTIGYQFLMVGPDVYQIIKGLVYPGCDDCESSVFIQAIGLLGSTIMPHNLYMHSGLVKSRVVDRSQAKKVREANRYFFWESFVGLSVSLIINIMIVSVFAQELFLKTNADVMNICTSSHIPHDGVFPNNMDTVELDLYKGGVYLGCQYGAAALYIWGVGVLAAGEGTTMTGCYAGQLAMEGFLQLKWSKWKRVLFTRLFAIFPTFFVAFYSTMGDLSKMNDFLNALMSIQIPFATLPLVAFTSNPELMGQFVNSIPSIIVACLISALVIAVNVYFVWSSVVTQLSDYRLLSVLLVYAVLYISICVYLVLHMVANMITHHPISKRILRDSTWRNNHLQLWSSQNPET